MSKISAKVVAHSKNTLGQEICSMEVIMPRFILAEFNTHRMFSRNSASSRAIPFEKMVKMVEEIPFIPMAWQKDHKGMQGTEYFTEEAEINYRNMTWLQARDKALEGARILGGTLDVTKQLCNRLLEPFMYHKVLVTATEWENFFALRCPRYVIYGKHEAATTYPFRSRKDALKACPDLAEEGLKVKAISDLDWLKLNQGQAEIHMMELAEQMWDAMNESTPKELKAGEWHIPYGDQIDTGKVIEYFDSIGMVVRDNNDYQNIFIKVSTASNARISYTTVGEEDKAPNYLNDVKLHDRLFDSKHMSPFEHCAKAMNKEEYYSNVCGKVPYIIELGSGHELKNGSVHSDKTLGWSGNFKGFIQYRKTLAGENITAE